jgi:transcriptional regulator GlxA family with amidase domain
MELLVARRTQKLLALEPPGPAAEALAPAGPAGLVASGDLPLAPLAEDGENVASQVNQIYQQLGPESTLPRQGVTASQADAQFLRRAVEIVDRHLSDYEFDVEALAKQMAVSRRQFFRRLKAVTGGTPNALIRAMRLKRAAYLLRQSQMTITEITYAVGFSDLKHFRTVFREQFGVLPGDYGGRASSRTND